LLVNQIKNVYQTKHVKLKQYRNEVWDYVHNFFLAFNITFIPREKNQLVDSLALAARTFKAPLIPQIKYEIKHKFRTSIPDNVKYWNFFEDDDQIKRFLETFDDFSALQIDEDEDLGEEQNNKNLINSIANHDIIELKGIHFHKGLIPLEILFDKNYVHKKHTHKVVDNKVEDCNLGYDQHPKMVKLRSSLPADFK